MDSGSLSPQADDILPDDLKPELKAAILIPAMPWFIASSVVAVVGAGHRMGERDTHESVCCALLEILGCQVSSSCLEANIASVPALASVVEQLIQLRTTEATGLALGHTSQKHAASYARGLNRWLAMNECVSVWTLAGALSESRQTRLKILQITVTKGSFRVTITK